MGFSPALGGRNWWDGNVSWIRSRISLLTSCVSLYSDWNSKRVFIAWPWGGRLEVQRTVHIDQLLLPYGFVMAYLMVFCVLKGFLPVPTRAQVVQVYVCILVYEVKQARVCWYMKKSGTVQVWEWRRPRERAAWFLRLLDRSVISSYGIALFILFNDADLCVE